MISGVFTVRLSIMVSTDKCNIQRACLSVSVAEVLRLFMLRVAFADIVREVLIPVETSEYTPSCLY